MVNLKLKCTENQHLQIIIWIFNPFAANAEKLVWLKRDIIENMFNRVFRWWVVKQFSN